MTVTELIEKLKTFDGNANVFCSDNSGGGYTLTDVEYDKENNHVEFS